MQAWGLKNKHDNDKYWFSKEKFTAYETDKVLGQCKRKLDALRIYGNGCDKEEWRIFIRIVEVRIQE
jgi:hypothetical protein